MQILRGGDSSLVRLALTGVTRRFGGLVAVDNFSAEFEAGELCAIIGPNGSGKTTLLNLISGLYPLDAGQVWLDGERIDRLGPVRIAARGVVRTFQIPKVFKNMTVRENLLAVAAADHRSESLRQVAAEVGQALAAVGLEPLAGAPARALSGGQTMLLQLAQAFLHRPVKLLLLDEPFAGVSPAVKDVIFDLINRINRDQGATVLLVSHEMSTVRALASRILVMASGRLIADGPLDGVASNPAVIDAYLGQPL
jgi:ABC-type branched-subunit amino acid transport system ATPase component